MENEFCSQALHKDSDYPKVIWQLPPVFLLLSKKGILGCLDREWPNKLPRGFPPQPHFSSVSIHEADDFTENSLLEKQHPSVSNQPSPPLLAWIIAGIDLSGQRVRGKALVRQLPWPPEKPGFEKCNPWKLRRIRKIHVPITYFTVFFVEIMAFIICWRITWVCS